MRNIFDIKFVEDGCVEITNGESVFRLPRDERGLLIFPESLKEKLPPYAPKMVEHKIRSRRQNPDQGAVCTLVNHKAWCRELRGKRKCNCDPDFFDLEIGDSGMDHGKLTCKECGQFSKGEMILHDVVENEIGCWDRFWIEGGDMFYWLVGIPGTEIRLLICHLCMISLHIKFPNGIEDEEDSVDHKLH
jgi:hypothetical protein